MKSIIREMYFDVIEGNEIRGEKEYAKARKICDEAYDKLEASFTEEQAELFKQYYDAEGYAACEWESYIFERGFKLGMLLAVETMS